MKLNLFLAKPFEYLSTVKSKWIYILSSTGFAIFFMGLFQPYGLSKEIENPINSNIEITIFFLSVSVIVFCGLSLSQFLFRPLFKFTKITIKQYCKWYVFEILIVTLVNFGISFLIPDLGDDFEKELNVPFQLKIYFQSFIALMFPFFGAIIYEFVQRLSDEVKELEEKLKSYLRQYAAVSYKESEISIKDEKDNLAIRLKLDDFLYAESGNQYVLVHYLKNGDKKKVLVRNRLKIVLEQMNKLPIKRCHRSYIVNLLHVKTIDKIDKKYFLVLKTEKIPISKSYLKEIKEEIGDKV